MVLARDGEHRNSDHAGQLSLFSSEELEALRSRAPAAARTPSSQSDKVRKPHRPDVDSLQDELPFRR
jgi:hypothetical protein